MDMEGMRVRMCRVRDWEGIEVRRRIRGMFVICHWQVLFVREGGEVGWWVVSVLGWIELVWKGRRDGLREGYLLDKSDVR